MTCTLPITTATRSEVRVRAWSGCHANSREETLWSGFSQPVPCVFSQSISGEEKGEEEEEEEEEVVEKGGGSRRWLEGQVVAVVVFFAVSLAVLVLAVAVGYLVVP